MTIWCHGAVDAWLLFHAVMLAEGGYPESQASRVDWTRLLKPTFWIPGYADNDARLRKFRRVGNLLPTGLRKVEGVARSRSRQYANHLN